MLRVGLTGGLGSGKSTVAAMLAAHGAHVINADDLGRDLMRPGHAVYAAIVEHFGPSVVRSQGDSAGELDRGELARLAFAADRVEELNAIVHPAVIAQQATLAAEIGEQYPQAVVVVESALIFETKFGGQHGWKGRFDRLVLVTASDQLKLARYVSRCAAARLLDGKLRGKLQAEARGRLARQMPDEQKLVHCDFVLSNEGSIQDLARQVEALWRYLIAESR